MDEVGVGWPVSQSERRKLSRRPNHAGPPASVAGRDGLIVVRVHLCPSERPAVRIARRCNEFELK